MATQGLAGFRYKEKDRLAYNHADSHPDILGLKLLREFRAIEDWSAVLDRVDSLIPLPETRPLGDHTSMAETEIRRAFPDLEYKCLPKNIYDLYRPLQGSLQPYLDGRLMFMPDASDFIQNSLHCDWGYIANFDTDMLEIWKGSQHSPDPENRYGTEHDRMGYYPCRLIKEYDLDDLPEPGRYLQDYNFYKDLTQAHDNLSGH